MTASNASTRKPFVVSDDFFFTSTTGGAIACVCKGTESAASPVALTIWVRLLETFAAGFVGGAILVLAREERTEVFFVVLGALLVFFAEPLLFAFFDGDTDDLYCGSIAVVRVTRWDGHQHIESLDNLTEDTMLIIEMGRGSMGDEELRSIGSRS